MHKASPNVTYNGFSLVELSIVLVILGLLTGGILSGQSLIRAAEIRSVATEMVGYQTASKTFRDKYMATPGDMANATLFWGKLAAECNGHTGTAAADGVCNGNGNGIIIAGTGGGAGHYTEAHMVWKHLAKAGLINGTFTGIAGAADTWNSTAGTNVPASRISGTGYIALTTGPTMGTDFSFATNLAPWWFSVEYPNAIAYGTPTPLGVDAALSPEEAWNIDTKIDDGRPAYGKAIGVEWEFCAIADSGADATNNFNASYRLTETAKTCTLVFREVL